MIGTNQSQPKTNPRVSADLEPADLGGSSQVTAWGVAAVATLIATLLMVSLLRPLPPADPPIVLRASISPPPGTEFGDIHQTRESQVAVSPDGRSIVFVAGNQLWVRPLNRASPGPISGTENASHPFWAPDSSIVGFFADGMLRSVAIAGGPVTIIAEAPHGQGGSWGPDDSILFAPDERAGISRVEAKGGEPTELTMVDGTVHTTHRWPEYLADGRNFLYFATSHANPRGTRSGIYLSSIAGGQPRLVTVADSKSVVSAGRLLFLRDGDLWAQIFNTTTLQLEGEVVGVADAVRYRGDSWFGLYSGSSREVLAYETGVEETGARLTQLDRLGNVEGTLGERELYWDLRISPQGDRLAVALGSPQPELWIYSLDGQDRHRVDLPTSFNRAPVWSPDGERLAFAAMNNEGRLNMYVLSMQSGEVEMLLESEVDQVPTSWSADGQWLAFNHGSPGATEIWGLPMNDGSDLQPVVQTDASVGDGQFSPNGEWLLFTSRESGVDQVYVTAFPDSAERWQLSASNWSSRGRWSPTGNEIYFATSHAMLMEVSLRRRKGGGLDVGMPRMLFSFRRDHSLFRGLDGFYDVLGEGESFILAPGPERAPDQGVIRLVVPWAAELAEVE